MDITMNRIIFIGLTLITAFGCADSGSEEQTANSQETSQPSVDGSPYLLNAEPDGVLEVLAAREAAEDGAEIVVEGRIGGSVDPWIEGRAAFTIVDNSLKACSDIPGDKCGKPWDYCCETTKLPTATALVKVVDDDGELIKAGAKQLLNVKALSTVVVNGKAKRDEEGNLTVLATGVFVKKL